MQENEKSVNRISIFAIFTFSFAFSLSLILPNAQRPTHQGIVTSHTGIFSFTFTPRSQQLKSFLQLPPTKSYSWEKLFSWYWKHHKNIGIIPIDLPTTPTPFSIDKNQLPVVYGLAVNFILNIFFRFPDDTNLKRLYK
jgi:hypothetical protein